MASWLGQDDEIVENEQVLFVLQLPVLTPPIQSRKWATKEKPIVSKSPIHHRHFLEMYPSFLSARPVATKFNGPS